MAQVNPRDKSRSALPRRDKRVNVYRTPPQGTNWIWLTEDFISSPAYTSLSINANRALWRIIAEYLAKNRNENGQLIVTHPQFVAHGVTGRLIADAIDELVFKGLVRALRGRAADGTPHPTRFRLTFYGDRDGNAASHDWKAIGSDDTLRWEDVRPSKAAERSGKAGRKKNSSLHEGEIPHCTFVKLTASSGGSS